MKLFLKAIYFPLSSTISSGEISSSIQKEQNFQSFILVFVFVACVGLNSAIGNPSLGRSRFFLGWKAHHPHGNMTNVLQYFSIVPAKVWQSQTLWWQERQWLSAFIFGFAAAAAPVTTSHHSWATLLGVKDSKELSTTLPNLGTQGYVGIAFWENK